MSFTLVKKLTLDHTQCGTADSSNWALVVCLDGVVQTIDPDFATVANGGVLTSSSGYDARPFSDEACTTALDFKLVRYVATTGLIIMWVRVPTLSHTADTVIYMGLGDASITTDGSSSSTWNSAFKGVYDFGDGTTLSGTDLTSNANNGSNFGMAAAAGKIHGAASSDGSSRYMEFGSMGGVTGGTVTLEAWIKVTDLSFGYQAIFGDNAGADGLEFRVDQTAGTLTLNKQNAAGIGTSSGAVSAGAWVYAGVTYDPVSGACAFYINGAASGTATSAQTITPSNVRIGTQTGNAEPFKGTIDEARVSNVIRSASWIAANYNSQKDSSTFIAWSDVTPSPPTDVSYADSPALAFVGDTVDHAPTGGTGATSWSEAPTPPDAVAFNTTNGHFAGTLTDDGFSAATDYVATATNGAGSKNGTLNLEVAYQFTITCTNPDGSDTCTYTIHFDAGTDAPSISYATSPLSATIHDIVAMAVSSIGGAVTIFEEYSGDALSSCGLVLDPLTGLISGQLNASGSFTGVVRAVGPGGHGDATWAITSANTVPVTSWGSPWIVDLASSPTRLPLNTGGDAITNYAEVAGAPNTLSELNASIDASTGELSFGVGGATPRGTYVIWLRATNAIGVGNTYVLTIIVRDQQGGGPSGPFERHVPGHKPVVREVFREGPFERN